MLPGGDVTTKHTLELRTSFLVVRDVHSAQLIPKGSTSVPDEPSPKRIYLRKVNVVLELVKKRAKTLAMTKLELGAEIQHPKVLW